jgi:hypothetical protein
MCSNFLFSPLSRFVWCRGPDALGMPPCTGGSIRSPLGCSQELRSAPLGAFLHDFEVNQRQMEEAPFVAFFVGS